MAHSQFYLYAQRNNSILMFGFKLFLFQLFFSTAFSQQGTLSLMPLENVAIPGSSHNFVCTSNGDEPQQIQWLVNGTRLENLNQRNGIECSFPFGVGILHFSNIPVEYSNTTIQCIATFTSGKRVSSDDLILLVQGLLSAVGSLTATFVPLDTNISLTWTPPFSLDITNIDPDIIGYCVCVAKFTSSLVIYSECNITDTQYNYTVSPNDIACDNYIFTITPVNVVGSGTSASVIRGTSPSEPATPLLETEMIIELNSNLNRVILSVSALVCSGSVSLQDIYDSSYMLGPIEVTPDDQDNSIRFMIPRSRVNLNRFYDATFTLINSAGLTASNINISTYDVQDITYNIQEEPVIVDYIENTEASGALLVLMYLDQDGNIVCNQSIYAAIRRSEDNFTLPMGDPAINNTYMGLAYDIERNGLEDKAYPAVRKDVDSGRKYLPPDYINKCNVTNMNGTASVSCVDSTSSISGYQVVLLLQDDRNNLTAVSIRLGTQVTLSIPSGNYCVLELPMEDNELTYSKVKYSYSLEFSSSASKISVSASVVIFVCAVMTMTLDKVFHSHQSKILFMMFFLQLFFLSAYSETLIASIIPCSAANTTQGGNIVFTCQLQNRNIQDISWFVNETQLVDDNQIDGVMVKDYDRRLQFGQLIITDIPVDYDDTTIQCQVNLTSAEVIESKNVTIMVSEALKSGPQNLIFLLLVFVISVAVMDL